MESFVFGAFMIRRSLGVAVRHHDSSAVGQDGKCALRVRSEIEGVRQVEGVRQAGRTTNVVG